MPDEWSISVLDPCVEHYSAFKRRTVSTLLPWEWARHHLGARAHGLTAAAHRLSFNLGVERSLAFFLRLLWAY